MDGTNLVYALEIGRIENLQRQFPLRSQIQAESFNWILNDPFKFISGFSVCCKLDVMLFFSQGTKTGL